MFRYSSKYALQSSNNLHVETLQRLIFSLHLLSDSVPCLSHIGRLQVRALLGPDILMRTNVVQQLPVPNLLHDFLKFRDIPEASYPHAPLLPILQRIEEHRNTHQHRHVLWPHRCLMFKPKNPYYSIKCKYSSLVHHFMHIPIWSMDGLEV